MTASHQPGAGNVTRMPRAVAAIGLALAVLAGCSAPASRETSPPKRVSPGDLVAVEGPSPAGRFYAKAGERDLDADLYEVSFTDRQFRRITDKARVSTVGGCKDKVVVAAAQREFGYVDTLQQVESDKLVSLPGIGTPHASDPHLSSDCQLLYLEIAGNEPNLIQQVKIAGATGEPRVVFADHPDVVGGATWGPDGQIVVVKRLPTGTRLVIIRANGTTQEIDPGADVGNPQWSSTGWLALTVLLPQAPPTAAVFINPTNGERSTLDGWLPLSWSPDGQQLLVAEAKNGTTLAVVEVSDLTKTRNVGVSEVGTVWDAVWLPPA